MVTTHRDNLYYYYYCCYYFSIFFTIGKNILQIVFFFSHLSQVKFKNCNGTGKTFFFFHLKKNNNNQENCFSMCKKTHGKTILLIIFFPLTSSKHVFRIKKKQKQKNVFFTGFRKWMYIIFYSVSQIIFFLLNFFLIIIFHAFLPV